MATIIKKLSVKTVVGEIILADLPEKGSVDVMRAVGIATGTQTGMSTYGEWVALKGSFQAVNLLNGEEFRSNKCFVPDVVTDGIAVALSQEGTTSVEFGVLVSVKRNPSVAKGYDYAVSPLIEQDEAAPLGTLLTRVPALKLKGKT